MSTNSDSEDHNFPEECKTYIGAIHGPSFGLIDTAQFIKEKVREQLNFCISDFLLGINEDLYRPSQVVLMATPNLIKYSNCYVCYDDDHCNFSDAKEEISKDIDYIFRAWFPMFDEKNKRWEEATVSFGGLMVACRYLSEKKILNKPWKCAYWCKQQKKWEIFRACKHKPNQPYYKLILDRTEFNIETDTYAKYDNFLKKAVENENNPVLAENINDLKKQFKEQYGDNRLGLKSFKLQDGRFQLIPFLPLFIGEFQIVIPVKVDFRRKLDELIGECQNPEALEETFSYYNQHVAYVFSQAHEFDKLIPQKIDNDKQQTDPSILDIFRDDLQEIFNDKHVGVTIFGFKVPRNIKNALEYITIEPNPRRYAYGHSLTGAVASAIAFNILDPSNANKEIELKGIKKVNDLSVLHNAFKKTSFKNIRVTLNDKNQWEVIAPVKAMCETTHKNMTFIRNGRG